MKEMIMTDGFDNFYNVGGIIFEPDNDVLIYGTDYEKKSIGLTRQESKILLLLITSINKDTGRRHLIEYVFGEDNDANARSVEVIIDSLRKKLTKANPDIEILYTTINMQGYDMGWKLIVPINY